MENRPVSTGIDHGSPARPGRWDWLEARRSSAFVVAGSLVFTSLFAPLGISLLIARPWLLGLIIVGLAVVSVAVGLLGLYPALRGRAPGLALAGAGSATVAGAAAAVLVGLSSAALVSGLAFGVEFTVPMEAFLTIAVMMALGYSLGFLAFGVAGRKATALSGRVTNLLLVGGVALLVPLAGELLRIAIGTGPPSWLVFPVILIVAADTIGVGVALRQADGARGAAR